MIVQSKSKPIKVICRNESDINVYGFRMWQFAISHVMGSTPLTRAASIGDNKILARKSEETTSMRGTDLV